MKKRIPAMLVALWAVSFAVTAFAQSVPNLIHYQGKLMDGTNLFTGTVPIVFRLYDAPTGGAFPYCVDSNTVAVVDGLYATHIGDDIIWGSLDNALIQPEVWIEVEIAGQRIEPRERLAAVGFARYAAKLPPNSVDLSMIQDNAVQYWHVANHAIRANHIQAGAISNAHLAAGSVNSTSIADGSIDFDDIGQNGASPNQIMKWNGSAWKPSNDDTGASPLLSYRENGTFASAPVATGNDAIAMGYGARAHGHGSIVGGGQDNEVGTNAMHGVIGGGHENAIQAGASRATIGGGWRNQVATNADFAVIGGGEANRTDAPYATVAGGERNRGQGYFAFVGGGCQNWAAGCASVVGGGGAYRQDLGGGVFLTTLLPNRARGDLATIGGGWGNAVATNAFGGTIPGGALAHAANYGEMAYASGGFPVEPLFSRPGSAQASLFVLRRQTVTDKVWEFLHLDGAGENFKVGTNDTVTVQALVAARSNAGLSAGYRIECLLKGVAAGGVQVCGLTIVPLYEDVAGWDVDVIPGAGQEVLFRVSGNGETIRWVATVRTAQVGW